jgi:hypothetical protein
LSFVKMWGTSAMTMVCGNYVASACCSKCAILQ